VPAQQQPVVGGDPVGGGQYVARVRLLTIVGLHSVRRQTREPPEHVVALTANGRQTVWTWNRLVVPGKPLGSPAVMPTR
jgi:hypothetical protein